MGVRDRYDYTDAMIHHSLFTRWLKANGMETDKNDESTRDIICLDFQFGLRSYKEELVHVKQMRKTATEANDTEKLETIDKIQSKIESNKDKYKKLSKDDIRRIFYTEGVSITYQDVINNKTGEIKETIIHYKMLYRNPSKAKQGSCMFIRDELYDRAYEWITMGIGPLLPEKGAKIVEISAYAPLSTSAIEGTVTIPVEDVLILKDQDSFFRTIADIVRAEDYEVVLRGGKKETRKRCVVHRELTDVKNTLWDGMALIETSVMPGWCNGMALLRNHFFKACAFRTKLQMFIKDYCNNHDIDYQTYTIKDMFGNDHLAKDIKIITTDNACKFKKFADVLGGSFSSAYDYWCNKVHTDGSVFGIVKSDHPSKLGNVQQMSYQMINTLPCTEEDIYKIAKTSVEYVELLKRDNDEFEKYLRKNATAVNHYEMLADLYQHNKNFQNSRMWRTDKKAIINAYVSKLRNGKITVNGDNLTVCGNPYALLMYAVGENWKDDPTFNQEDGVIQVYTRRFGDGEFLCGIRNPHNSANNLGYFKNVRHPLMEKYFDFSNNIMAVNCIHTDVQARLNGEDFDSDFNFVTNQPQMVEAAKIAYRDYPTVVNEVPESGITYDNNLAEYARMDSQMQQAQKAIGGSSDTAQLCQSYYWDKIAKNEIDDDSNQYYENTVILAVCAQLAIDGCKKVFAVDVNNDIQRIRQQSCMQKEKDYPRFMKWTHEIQITKNGKQRPQDDIKKEKNKLSCRIDPDIVCPMNWLIECLDKIQGVSFKNDTEETYNYLVKQKKKANFKQLSKIRKLVEEYDSYVRYCMGFVDEEMRIIKYSEKTDEVLNQLHSMSIGKDTMIRLIATSLGYVGNVKSGLEYKNATKYSRKMLTLLYRYDKNKFINCFKTA